MCDNCYNDNGPVNVLLEKYGDTENLCRECFSKKYVCAFEYKDKLATIEAELSRERNRANTLGTNLTKENVRLASLLERVEADNAALKANIFILEADLSGMKKNYLNQCRRNTAIKKRFLKNETELCDERAALKAKLGMVASISAMAPELNLSNYDGTHVEELNQAMVDVYCILSTAEAPLAVDTCDVCSDGTPGWYSVTACWGGGESEMPLLGKEVTVVLLPSAKGKS